MKALVITSIARSPTPALHRYADILPDDFSFILIGDTKSPTHFKLAGCRYWNIKEQQALPYSLAQILPTAHYARKNIGYLLAIQEGAEVIYETDDDNLPYQDFFTARAFNQTDNIFTGKGWCNIYSHFIDNHEMLWARGFPLELIKEQEHLSKQKTEECFTPILQGLADHNPDVDAVYRLTAPLPRHFLSDKQLSLINVWSPFNSQNTIWHPQAYLLLYLPSYCPFRVCDIWRSFIAQRICFENGWGINYFSPTVRQDRNYHNLLDDFRDEYVGYLNNMRMVQHLLELPLKGGAAHIADNLLSCYRLLIQHQWIGAQELGLVERWINDVEKWGGISS